VASLAMSVSSGIGAATTGAAIQTIGTSVADARQRRLAVIAMVLLSAAFIAAAPFAQLPLVAAPAFIPAYDTALIVVDLITAVLLLAQLDQERSVATLCLAGGYLFDAGIVVPHALSYPGLLTPAGWLTGGSQTTAWLYMFWHAGFALFVVSYVVAKRILKPREIRTRNPVTILIIAVLSLVTAFTFIAVNAEKLLPAVMAGNSYTAAMKFVVGSVWATSLGAIFVLMYHRPYSILDLSLIVVMFAWVLDIALSAGLNASRYDVGFYIGRLHGLCAALFVLIVILVENSKLYGRLAEASHTLRLYLHELDTRAQERTSELASANRRLEAILQASPVGIFMLDMAGKVLLWTASAERIFGYTAEEAVGKLPPYLTDAAMPEFRQILARAAAAPKTIGYFETRRQRKDGTTIDVSVRCTCVEDQAGVETAIMFAVADRTDLRKIELQLQQAQKMEAIGNLTGGMAHDFNNILGVIIGNLDLLLELADSAPDQEELAREALDAALRGADLTRRLLAFARKQPLQPQPTDINELVTRMTRLLQRTLGEDIAIALELGQDVWTVVIDPAQLESSLANLMNNARDAMPNGGQITVATSNSRLDQDYASLHPEVVPGEYALIEVVDTGCGMSAEVAARIFEPFYTTKSEGKGTGLGLSMVFGFVRQSGGHINLYSEPGIGTTFRVYLPRATDGTRSAKAADATPVLAGRGEKVLAVEDNPALRRTLVRQLKELGYQVSEAEDAGSALAMLTGEPVDLLMTDVILPGEVGVGDLAREAQARWPGLKLLLSSGFPENRVSHDPVLRSLPYLRKPYRREELARAVREVLGD